jgi:hypothetical protein
MVIAEKIEYVHVYDGQITVEYFVTEQLTY